MKSEKKLAFGSILGFLGAAGIILGPLLGLSELARPWSFILGFIFGLLAGVGVALSLSGFLEKRRR
jgi:branched-subunit amino acid permease